MPFIGVFSSMQRVERRKSPPVALVQVGMMIGFFFGALVADVQAQAVVESWASPQTILYAAGVIFSAGMAYHLVQDTRKRQDRLESRQDRMEEVSATKTEVGQLREDIRDVSKKLDRLFETRG